MAVVDDEDFTEIGEDDYLDSDESDNGELEEGIIDETKRKVWLVFDENEDGHIEHIYGIFNNDTKAERVRRANDCKKRDYVLK